MNILTVANQFLTRMKLFISVLIFTCFLLSDASYAGGIEKNNNSLVLLRIFYIDPLVSTQSKIRSGDMLNAKAKGNTFVTIINIDGAALSSLSQELESVFILPPIDPYLQDTLDIRVLFEFTTIAGGKYLLSWQPDWNTEWINVAAEPLKKSQVDALLKYLPTTFYDRVLYLRAQEK